MHLMTSLWYSSMFFLVPERHTLYSSGDDIPTRFFCKFKNEISKNEAFIKSIYFSFKKIILIPHSLHNYQIMSRKYNSHLKSTLLITILNIVWCLPLAMTSHFYSEYSIIALLTAIIPYMIICIYNKTGIEKY